MSSTTDNSIIDASSHSPVPVGVPAVDQPGAEVTQALEPDPRVSALMNGAWSYVDPDAYARALVVADKLKSQLEARLIGQPYPEWESDSGHKVGPSRLVEIRQPVVPGRIAQWLSWLSVMREDDSGKTWLFGLASFISATELYAMFRNAFAGIGILVCHPHADLFDDGTGELVGVGACKAERRFRPSGRKVIVNNGESVFVRPIGDLTNSAWVSAQLRAYCWYWVSWISCPINSLEFGNQDVVGWGVSAIGNSCMQTYYIDLSGYSCEGKWVLFPTPIARVVEADRLAGRYTFELDQSVETFDPNENC